MKNRLRLLVIVRSDSFAPDNTLFPAIRHMAADARVESIHILDKLDNPDLCEGFAGGPDIPLFVRRADESFSIETYPDLMLEKAMPGDFNIGWYRTDPLNGYAIENLAKALKDTFAFPILNPLDAILHFGSKEYLVGLQDILNTGSDPLMPPVRLCHAAGEVEDFRQSVGGDIVVKGLRGYGGHDVFRILENGERAFENQPALQAYIDKAGGVLAMQYVHNPNPVDDRVVASYNPETQETDCLCVVRRRAKGGEWRCNLTQGATAEAREPDSRQVEIVKRLSPLLARHGVILTGIDTLSTADGRAMLSEINITNPGGMKLVADQTGIPYPAIVADRHIAAMQRIMNGETLFSVP